MLKRLTILGLLVAVVYVVAQVPREGGAKQDHPAKNTNGAHKDGPPFAQPSLDLRITVHDEEREAEHKPAHDQSHNWKEAFWPGTWSNWALVLVGALAGLVAWLTLRRIRRQTDLMNRNNAVALASAKAALESAKTANDQIRMMKNKERARIQVTPLPFEVIFPDEPNQIMLELVNIGPTIAFDVRVEAGARIAVTGLETEQGE